MVMKMVSKQSPLGRVWTLKGVMLGHLMESAVFESICLRSGYCCCRTLKRKDIARPQHLPGSPTWAVHFVRQMRRAMPHSSYNVQDTLKQAYCLVCSSQLVNGASSTLFWSLQGMPNHGGKALSRVLVVAP